MEWPTRRPTKRPPSRSTSRPISRTLVSPWRRTSIMRPLIRPIKRTWRPIVAGWITDALGGTGLFVGISLFQDGLSYFLTEGSETPYAVLVIFLVIPPIVLGALALAGGYFAIKRRRWGWALTGAIAGLVMVLPFLGVFLSSEARWNGLLVILPISLSIISIILIVRSKNEFARKPRRFHR
jgi:hypothetical protein